MSTDVKERWLQIQKKTFCGWVNSHLRKRGEKIDDLLEDFKDGLKLASLLSLISDETFPYKLDRKCRMRIQQIGNLNYCLKFIADKGVKLAGVGAEEIADGNLTMTLGMVWTIILRWQIADISEEELSAKEALLLWCQKKTKGYKDVDVKNFHMSFQDGLAFCALIHKHRPDLLDFDSLDKENKVHNLNLAFDVAEKHLDIPRLLDANDIVDLPKPDERSIITYVSMYYHVFASSAQAETAARRVGKLIDFTAANDQTKLEYQQRAGELGSWIDDATNRMNERNFDDTLEGAQSQLSDLRGFQTNEKPPKAAEKYELEAYLNALNTRLDLNNRPKYQPEDNLATAGLDAAWRGLEDAEKQRNLDIIAELRRQKKIKNLSGRFDDKAGRLERWTTDRQQFIENAPLGETIAAVSANLRNHETFDTELTANDVKRNRLTEMADQLEAERYQNIDQVKERLANINDRWGNLENAGADRKARLEDELRRLQEIEDQQKDFARRALDLNVWMDETEDNLGDIISVDSVEEIEALRAQYEQVVADHGSKQGELGELEGLYNNNNQADALSQVKFPALQDRWNNLNGLLDSRKADLEAEADRQAQHEQLRRDFADKAAAFQAFADEQSAAISNLSGSTEQQIDAADDLATNQEANRNLFDDCVNVSNQLASAGVLDNPHTSATIEGVRQQWDALSLLTKRKQETLQRLHEAKQNAGISDEQLTEFTEAFNHFDKDKDQFLDRLELGGCLRALGQECNLEEQGGDLDRILGEIGVDGKVNLESFTNYMVKISADQDTPDQVIEAFRTIAGGKDFVTEADLSAVMDQEKVKYCTERMQPHSCGEGYDYESFTQQLYAR